MEKLLVQFRLRLACSVLSTMATKGFETDLVLTNRPDQAITNEDQNGKKKFNW